MGGSRTTVQAPAPVNPAQVGADTLQTQLRLAPDVFRANQEYLPQYAALANQIAAQMLPGLLEQQTSANTAQRTADIGDVRALAPEALAAWRAANPELGATLGTLGDRIAASGGRPVPQIGDYRATVAPLGEASRASVAPLGAAAEARAFTARPSALFGQLSADASSTLGQLSPLQIELQRQAMDQLGAELSPDQIRQSQQDTRAAYAARGLYDSNQAVGAEILNLDQARAQRRAAAQQFAMGVDQAGQQQLAAGRSYAGSVAGMGIGRDQFNAGQRQQASLANADAANRFALTRYGTDASLAQFNADAANRFALTRYGTDASLAQFNAGLAADRDRTNAQLALGADQQAIANYFNLANQYAATAQDPYQLVLGRSGAPAAAAGLASSAGPTMFNPFDPAITQIYAANQANEMAARTATANNRAGVQAGALSALGNLGGAGLMALGMMCWVARAAYGEQNGRWLEFRGWLVLRAPDWFRDLYLEHGPAAGARVAADPQLAARVRGLMDGILNSEAAYA